MSDDKIDDRIRILPIREEASAPRLGAICNSCSRHWDLGELSLNLREVKLKTRHQCSATTDKQKAWPDVEPESTATDTHSLKNSIAQAKAQHEAERGR